MLHGVAPVGEAGAAAVRAHLDIDNLAGGQADDGHYALGLEAFGVLRRVDAHPPARLPALGVVHRLRRGNQLPGRPVGQRLQDTFGQGRTAVVGARQQKTRGEEDGLVVIAILLAENRDLVEELVYGEAFLFLNGGLGGAAGQVVRAGGFEVVEVAGQLRQPGGRQRGKPGVAGEVLKNTAPKGERVRGVVFHEGE